MSVRLQVVACEEALGVLAGQALVRDDGAAGRGAVRGLPLQGLAGLLALAGELGVGEAEPGDGAVAGADDQQLRAPVPAGVAGAVPVSGVPEQARALRGGRGGAAGDRGGVHQPQPLRGRRGGVREVAQGGLRQRRELPEPQVVLGSGPAAAGTGARSASGRRAASAARRRSAAGPAPLPGRRARHRSRRAACPGRERANPRDGMMRSVSST